MVIVCSNTYHGEMLKQLEALGFPRENILSNSDLHIGEKSIEEVDVLAEKYNRVFNMFEDEESRRIIVDRIRYYLLSAVPPVSAWRDSKQQYFDCFPLSDHEIVVDGGMYTGDTFKNYLRFSHGRFCTYYGFEPNDEIYKIALQNIGHIENVVTVPKGLWKESSRLRFIGGVTSGQLDEKGDRLVDVTSLDEFFAEKEWPTFIKMDIQGAELAALQGAKRIISKGKPKLAICAYHKPSDLYELPEIIKQFGADYKLRLRHYSDTIYETVLYAD
jgi:FkbM family methyltransferase